MQLFLDQVWGADAFDEVQFWFNEAGLGSGVTEGFLMTMNDTLKERVILDFVVSDIIGLVTGWIEWFGHVDCPGGGSA
jgi:hypothetical protein